MNRDYSDILYTSPDQLELYARAYEGDPSKPVLLCMHGLSRNSADFHDMLNRLPEYPAISVDQRGRGRSEYDRDPANYRPDVYCNDMFALLKHLDLTSVIAVGTSMGGLMTMMMSALEPGIFKAAVINDIGPEVDPAGLDRIRGYVGASGPFKNWDAAVGALKAQGPEIFPDFSVEDWLDFAKRTCIEQPSGAINFAYDPAIQTGVSAQNPSAVPPDLWPLFDSLNSLPVLLIRGETSDILSRQTAEKMAEKHPDLTYVNVPNRGHAPLLTEPVAINAIKSFLESVK